jgi:hypothetical protein
VLLADVPFGDEVAQADPALGVRCHQGGAVRTANGCCDKPGLARSRYYG